MLAVGEVRQYSHAGFKRVGNWKWKGKAGRDSSVLIIVTIRVYNNNNNCFVQDGILKSPKRKIKKKKIKRKKNEN